MRSALALALALAPLAGCLSAVEEPAPVSAATALPPAVEGRLWLPPSDGPDRVETAVPLPGVPARATILATVTLSGFYMVDTPPALADVLVELRDAAGEPLAEAHLTMEEPQAELEGVMPAAGDAALVILSYGGSDGEGYGDRVDYAVSFR